jgi:hypothetical protein
VFKSTFFLPFVIYKRMPHTEKMVSKIPITLLMDKQNLTWEDVAANKKTEGDLLISDISVEDEINPVAKTREKLSGPCRINLILDLWNYHLGDIYPLPSRL